MAEPLKSKRKSANISLHEKVLAAMDRLEAWEFSTRSHYVHSLVVPDLQRRGLLPGGARAMIIQPDGLAKIPRKRRK